MRGNAVYPSYYDVADLNEVNYGLLYRKSKKWVANNIPEHKIDPDFVYPDGESFRQMQQRSSDYPQFLAGTSPQKTILLVVHAGVIRGLVSQFLGLDYAAAAETQNIPPLYWRVFLRGHLMCTLQ